MSNPCAPVCCPCETVYFNQGEHGIVKADLSQWLSKNTGYTLTNNPLPTPIIINLSDGLAPLSTVIEVADWNTSNVGVKAFVDPKSRVVNMLVKAGTAPLGSRYRIDFNVWAQSCDQDMPKIKLPVCIIIEVTSC
jgi:hypothetical protein